MWERDTQISGAICFRSFVLRPSRSRLAFYSNCLMVESIACRDVILRISSGGLGLGGIKASGCWHVGLSCFR
jgi:hypothetical protein